MPAGQFFHTWCPQRACTRVLVVALAVGTHVHGQKVEEKIEQGMKVADLYGNVNAYAYYFTDLLVGSKSQPISVIIDTGSRVVGFPCEHCKHCGKHFDKPFDVSTSRTAKWIMCGTECSIGKCTNGRCTYNKQYSEGSKINGTYFEDLIAIGQKHTGKPDVTAQMGCHEKETKFFRTQLANGILGLAPPQAKAEPPTVLEALMRTTGKAVFSICLSTWGGRLTIGGYDNTTHFSKGGTIQWLQMQANHKYRVFPEGMSLVGIDHHHDHEHHEHPHPQRFRFVKDSQEFGDTTVVSGMTYSSFPKAIYKALKDNILAYCKSTEPEADISGISGMMDTVSDGCKAHFVEPSCWRLVSIRLKERSKPTGFPNIEIHFRGIAGETKVIWTPESYFRRTADPEVWCYSFVEGRAGKTVLGISWMLHKDIIFDIGHNRLGVAMANCPERHRPKSFELETGNMAEVSPEESESADVRHSVGVAAVFVLIGAAVVCWASHINMMATPQSQRGLGRLRFASMSSDTGMDNRPDRVGSLESMPSVVSLNEDTLSLHGQSQNYQRVHF